MGGGAAWSQLLIAIALLVVIFAIPAVVLWRDNRSVARRHGPQALTHAVRYAADGRAYRDGYPLPNAQVGDDPAPARAAPGRAAPSRAAPGRAGQTGDPATRGDAVRDAGDTGPANTPPEVTGTRAGQRAPRAASAPADRGTGRRRR
jgi:hypothetical protein